MQKLGCCTHYGEHGCDYGYVILPCFRVAVCRDCGEVTMVCNNVLGWIFAVFFAPFWRGKICVISGKGEAE